MSVGNFRGLDFVRVANETAARFGLSTIFGSDGIDHIRNIDWGKRYLWAVKFVEPTAPKPFENYFPASDAEITDGFLESFVFEQGQSSYRAPQKSASRNLTMTFYDNNDRVLQRWFSDWINLDILNNDQFMSCLNDTHAPVAERSIEFGNSARVWPVRKLQYFKVDNSLNPVPNTERTFYVYPEGDFNVPNSSASEAEVFTLTFVIVGEYKRQRAQQSNNDVLTRAKREATRLLGRFV